ncbi:phosphopyruvate hydratase [candidate division WS5 bacterium]|uniref:Enolase n=1 Tax=candidate division WS5 bacterium TaxID=2093353 RepID=A0A419DFZ2_9BACT|nr:MAG: phosphopyruvate hydratase [candidate division WS5 bacterium]
MKIKNINASEILDSRGIPTVSAEVELENGVRAGSSVPSGTSAGVHEALELRDGNISRFSGMGVTKACENIEKIISPGLKGMDASDQKKIDEMLIELDGTKNKGKLGANAILAVSIAIIRAHAQAAGKELFEIIGKTYSFNSFTIPKPLAVVIEGGKHSDSNADIQEYMIQVEESDIKENLNRIEQIYTALGKVLAGSGKSTNIGYEGAYGPSISSNREGLDLIMDAIRISGVNPSEVKIALDIASSEFYDKESQKYILKSENIVLSSSQMSAYLEELVRNYPIFSIEDALAEDDWEGWQSLYEKLGSEVILVGDDLFVTNIERIRDGIDRGAANAVLIKPNQIGTVTETIEAVKMAKFAGWEPIVSHRSGETNDTFIADLAVAIGSKYIKAGAPVRGERVAKYNRLLEISSLPSFPRKRESKESRL